MPMKNPPHPGDFIRTEIIEPVGSVGYRSRSRRFTSRVRHYPASLTVKADLSGDMALRIEKAFGVKMDTLMRMQASYDIAQTRNVRGKSTYDVFINLSTRDGAHAALVATEGKAQTFTVQKTGTNGFLDKGLILYDDVCLRLSPDRQIVRGSSRLITIMRHRPANI